MATLYLIGTPIGNIKDVSLRMLGVLRQMNYFFVEDSRKARLLLKLLKIDSRGKTIIAYDRQAETKKLGQLLSLLDAGWDVGLLTEAGMPGIADPGTYAVKLVRQTRHNIEVIPGVSALSCALSLCGFEADKSLFVGFLPKKSPDKTRLFLKIKQTMFEKQLLVVFFESPVRIKETVGLLKKLFAEAWIFLGRELTKKNQQLIWSKLEQLKLEKFVSRGEYTGVLWLKKE